MIKKRISRLRELIQRNQLDGLLISLPANRRYLSGFEPDDSQPGESSGHLLISAAGAFLLTDFRYKLTALEQAQYFETVIYTKGLAHSLGQLAGDLRLKKLGFEADALLVSQYQMLTKALPDIEFQPTTGFVSKLRKYKDRAELMALEKSALLMERVLDPIMNGPLVGRSEREVALQIVRTIEDNGGDGPAFPPIVASGPNAAEPHAEPGPRIIAEGEPVLFDVGAKLNGYHSDMSRTVVAGGLEKADDQFKKVYATVRQAQLTALELIMPGLLGAEADELARAIIHEAGYEGKFGHSLGHGIGLATHEAPSVGPSSGEMLTEGMVFTIEPGIYLAGWGGVRLEVMVALEAEGCRLIGSGGGFYDLT